MAAKVQKKAEPKVEVTENKTTKESITDDKNVTVNITNNITQPDSNKKRVNWVLALIMSIIFGWIGVDRFIMGHIGLGILKLITFGGCGIWWLIDVILIATKYPFEKIEWFE